MKKNLFKLKKFLFIGMAFLLLASAIEVKAVPKLWNGGTTNWALGTNWTPNGIPTSGDDVTIPATGIDPVISSAESCNLLTIDPLAALTISPIGSLTASGNTVNNGTFNIQSNALNEGSFIDNGSISGTGTFNIQRWVSTQGSSCWESISSPISNASSTLFTNAIHNLWYVDDAATTAWVSIANGSPQIMTVMKGYYRKYVNGEGDGNTQVTFSDIGGNVNTGAKSIGLGPCNNCWHLVGNPYPSAVDWDAAGWTKSGIDNAYWVRKRDGSVASYSTGAGVNGGTRYIPPMQGFWVQNPDIMPGTLGCNNTVRVHNAQNIYKSNPALDNNLLFRVTNLSNSKTDETYLRFGSYATDGFDRDYDAYKMFADDSLKFPQVYTNTDNINICINSFSELKSEHIVPVGFRTTVSGEYTFTADLVSSFTTNGNTVFLKDNQNGTYQDLSKINTYQFSSGNTDGLNRFELHFIPNASNIQKHNNISLNIYASDNRLHFISSDKLNGQLNIYDVLGNLVISNLLSGVTSGIIPLDMRSAMYIVKYTDNEKTIIKKVIINK